MEVTEMQERIMGIFQSSCCEYHIPDCNTNLFDSSCQVMPRDLLYVFMELKKQYPTIQFKEWVPSIEVFTIHSIAEAVCKQLEDQIAG